MRLFISIICCTILLFGCRSPGINSVSDADSLEALENSIMFEAEFDNAHLSDVATFIECCLKETESIKHYSVKVLCKPPDDTGINPYEKNPDYSGPHDGCNLRHVTTPIMINISFRDALDVIGRNAGLKWFVRDAVIYIDDDTDGISYHHLSLSLVKDVGKLAKLKVVDGEAVYFGGVKGEFYKLYGAIAPKGTEKEFLAMLNHPRPTVRIMGALCLAQKDKIHYEAQIRHLYDDNATVDFFPGGCSGSSEKVGSIVKQIMKNPKILEYKRGIPNKSIQATPEGAPD